MSDTTPTVSIRQVVHLPPVGRPTRPSTRRTLAACVGLGLLLSAGCASIPFADKFVQSEPEPKAKDLAAERRGDNLSVDDAGNLVEADPASAVVPMTYPAELPTVGTAAARAIVRHGRDQVDLVNLSKLPWPRATVWLNESYGLVVTHTQPNDIRRLRFDQFANERGEAFPTDNMQVRVEAVDLQLDDELARVRVGLAY